MELEEIDVLIARDGTVQVQVRGVKGPACLEVTKPLEDALGGQVETRRLTPEMDEALDADTRSHREQRGHDPQGA
jgi:hypothetical protein